MSISMVSMLLLSAERPRLVTLWKNAKCTLRCRNARYRGVMIVSPIPAAMCHMTAPRYVSMRRRAPYKSEPAPILLLLLFSTIVGECRVIHSLGDRAVGEVAAVLLKPLIAVILLDGHEPIGDYPVLNHANRR